MQITSVMAMGTIGLPQEIIEEILIRLPAKSLMRFKCVNKEWKTLFTAKLFIRKHTDHATFTNRVSKAILSSSLTLHSIETSKEEEEEGEHGKKMKDLPIEFPINLPIPLFTVKGYCDGIFCVVLNNRSLVLGNPCLGFGYDSSTDDYKIVRIVRWHYSGRFSKTCRREVEVFSLKSDSWRSVHDQCVGCWIRSGNATYLNGHVYWLAERHNLNYTCVELLLTFDMKEERFTETILPPRLVTCRFDELALLVGHLCLLGNFRHHVKLWFLDEANCWRRLKIIPYLPKWIGTPRYVLCCAWIEKDRILFGAGNENFILYNTRDETVEEIVLCKSFMKRCTVFPYVETLISLAANNN